MATPGGQAPSTAGSPVDSQGWPAEDPTQNVRATVDQLKDTLDREVAHLKEVGEIRATHLKEIADLRAKHAEAMMDKEAARLNSIRDVDIGAVQRATEVADARAGVLAEQLITTADRVADTLRTAIDPIIKDIQDLRKSQAEGGGERQRTADTRLNINTLVVVGSLLAFVIFQLMSR